MLTTAVGVLVLAAGGMALAGALGDDGGTDPVVLQGLPAVTFPFRVSSTEPVVLRVIASTKSCDCDWGLDLAWTSGGSTGTTAIAEGDRDFRTSASTAKAYGYVDGWSR